MIDNEIAMVWIVNSWGTPILTIYVIGKRAFDYSSHRTVAQSKSFGGAGRIQLEPEQICTSGSNSIPPKVNPLCLCRVLNINIGLFGQIRLHVRKAFFFITESIILSARPNVANQYSLSQGKIS